MALRVRPSGGLVARGLWSATPDRWLIRLRWLALAGMLSTTLLARTLVPDLDGRPLALLFALVGGSNLVWLLLAVRLRAEHAAALIAPQLALDVLLLGAILWFSGGLENPFAVFLTFQIVLAGLLASRRTTILITALTVTVAVSLWGAPALPLGTAALGARVVRGLGQIWALVALGLVTGAFVVVFLYRLEVMRERSARAEQLAGLGRIVAAMCHELNTPLGSILIAGTDLATVDTRGDDAAGEVRQLAGTITDQARRAADLIGLLRGQVSPGTQPESLDLAAFLADYVPAEMKRLGYPGRLDVECGDALQATVFRAALCQIVTNLLRNAVDALAGRADARVRVQALSVAGAVQIVVADNGPGIDPSLVDRLGEPFHTTKTAQLGTGLGLYASTLLAERMDGDIEIESRRGEGTRVIVSLRAARTTAERRAVVDDDDDRRHARSGS